MLKQILHLLLLLWLNICFFDRVSKKIVIFIDGRGLSNQVLCRSSEGANVPYEVRSLSCFTKGRRSDFAKAPFAVWAPFVLGWKQAVKLVKQFWVLLFALAVGARACASFWNRNTVTQVCSEAVSSAFLFVQISYKWRPTRVGTVKIGEGVCGARFRRDFRNRRLFFLQLKEGACWVAHFGVFIYSYRIGWSICFRFNVVLFLLFLILRSLIFQLLLSLLFLQ